MIESGTRRDAGQVPVPDEAVDFGQLDPGLGELAVLVAGRHYSPRLINDLLAGAVGLSVVTITAILLVRASHKPFVYWMGGWRPNHMVAIGISL